MKIVDKFKEFLNRKQEPEVNPEELEEERIEFREKLYGEIWGLLQTWEKVREEEKNLGGHEHFMKPKISSKIIELIKLDPTVLQEEDVLYETTIAMNCAESGLDSVLDFIVSEHKDILDEYDEDVMITHPMVFAEYAKEDIIEKYYLDDEKSLLRRDYDGDNVAMYCADFCSEDIVLKLLDNHKVSIQRDKQGFNLGMHCVKNNMEKAALKSLDNKEASIQQNRGGSTIGIMAARNHMESVVMKALENEEARAIVDNTGKHIGFACIDSNLNNCVLKALEYDELALALDADQRNMGVKCILASYMDNCVNKALQNKQAREQYIPEYDLTFGEFAKIEGYSVPEESSDETEMI